MGHSAGSDARGQAALVHALATARDTRGDTGLLWSELEPGVSHVLQASSWLLSVRRYVSTQVFVRLFAAVCPCLLQGRHVWRQPSPFISNPPDTIKLLRETGRAWPGGEESLERCALELRRRKKLAVAPAAAAAAAEDLGAWRGRAVEGGCRMHPADWCVMNNRLRGWVCCCGAASSAAAAVCWCGVAAWQLTTHAAAVNMPCHIHMQTHTQVRGALHARR